MKKKIGLLIASALMAIGAQAAATALCVTMRDGSNKVFLLSNKPVVSFGDKTLDINSDDVSASIDRKDISVMTFIDNDQVEDVADAEVFEYTGSTVRVDGHFIEIYSMAGVKVAFGQDAVGLDSLPAGVYIVRYGNTSVKILKN